jgi:ferric-dicitrate binding protein FerR (iron transport regulator)
MLNERWEYLLRRFYDKSCSPEERGELMEALRNAIPGEPDDMLMDDLIAEHKADVTLEAAEADQLYKQIRPITPVKNIRRWWMAAAAAILIIAASAGYFLLPQKQATTITAKIDVAPGKHKAILTLADGSQVALDSTGRQIILQGKTAISQQGGELVYDAKEEQQEPVYNTLTTPKGGQFRIILPDNSAVWLNAASSIRFPTAFTGNERNVEVTGEAYFEVSADAAKPFKVALHGGTMIKVLGTHFNVNAYTDEESIQTSLLEGKVEVTRGTEKVTLKPGQQANVAGSITVKELNGLGMTQVIAWKNGVFNFEQKDLKEVMRQLSRWYNVEVIYKGAIPHRIFGGELSRSLYLSEIVDVMKVMKVNVKIEEGSKLIITN